ncbi:MAG: hypothetical protein FWD94_01200 [Treponema sp.]|nr:hypothetical protein [Treponema sp.]
MTKANDQQAGDPSDLTPDNGAKAADGRGKPPAGTTGRPRTVEEHAKAAGVDPATLAAVMQAKKWAAGKTVPETEFKAAVGEFLGAAMGGSDGVTGN